MSTTQREMAKHVFDAGSAKKTWLEHINPVCDFFQEN